jgi:hypothetical protein
MIISRTALRREGLHDAGRLGEAHPSLVGKAPFPLWELVDVSPSILVSESFDKVRPAKELAVEVLTTYSVHQLWPGEAEPQGAFGAPGAPPSMSPHSPRPDSAKMPGRAPYRRRN